jgi:hypothetical protein
VDAARKLNAGLQTVIKSYEKSGLPTQRRICRLAQEAGLLTKDTK